MHKHKQTLSLATKYANEHIKPDQTMYIYLVQTNKTDQAYYLVSDKPLLGYYLVRTIES
jgi:hypothetical protein